MPQLPDDFAPHPARDASLASMQAVEAGDKAAWLALFADDAVVEDPIGPSPFSPDGSGQRGRAAIEAFYDSVIGPNEVRFRIDSSWAGGDEVANVGTISTRMPDGTVVHTDGVFTYKVDGDGKVVALRAYWEMDRLRVGG
ncbi:nuclear transport factor 2 family protein [Dermatobacter hominis]|uniref:nuclear transport factor 2 family protein n=1 Tax=Dermatobacter hominis TaxID=2884263 RepID=UPI001D12DF13|nr:nuclear transport factor 2 family protein [Dermatobacter hominis]UDY34727.1 nuclear transport factor 2 family protein [Dermatobacter hominis]